MEDVLGLSKIDILSQKEIVIHDAEKRILDKALERLLSHEPIQYVLGETVFYGSHFFVDQNVLIPRQETEELVDWIVKSNPLSRRILDIGTGSGCIAISLDLKLGAKTTGWDVSTPAIEVARRNATSLGADTIFKQIDVLDKVPTEKFDLIVSNPPYILDRERNDMHKNVLAYEPAGALFVSDEDPLLFYRRIVEVAEDLLSHSGWLYFEINESYGKEVWTLMKSNGFEEVELKKDLNGKDRMVRGKKL